MAQFTSSGGGGVPVSSTSDIVSYSIINQSLTTANTEVEIIVPTTAVYIHVFCRTDKLIKIAFTSGQSGTVYASLVPGSYYEYSKKSGSSLSLYVQSPTANQVLEVTYGHST